MVPSASVHRRATGIWPTIISTALWTMVHGVLAPISPASMGAASRSSGNVTTAMIVGTAVMSWKACVVSWAIGALLGARLVYVKCLLQNSRFAICASGILLELKSLYSENPDCISAKSLIS